jgi:phosphomevalonate kinase
VADDAFVKALDGLSKYKSTAEGAVKLVKEKYKTNDSIEYKTTKTLYNDAMKKFDDSLSHYENLIKAGKKIEPSKDLDEQVKNEVEALDKYAKEVTTTTKAIAIAVILEVIFTIIVKAWESYGKISEAERQRRLKILAEYRWKTFDDI